MFGDFEKMFRFIMSLALGRKPAEPQTSGPRRLERQNPIDVEYRVVSEDELAASRSKTGLARGDEVYFRTRGIKSEPQRLRAWIFGVAGDKVLLQREHHLRIARHQGSNHSGAFFPRQLAEIERVAR